jgi:Ran GTPase-activating protein (RanGAP) involved in mRNA processing and transport
MSNDEQTAHSGGSADGAPPFGTTAAIVRIRSNDFAFSRVDLSSLYLTDMVVDSLAEALRANTRVTELDLSRNDLEFSSALNRLFDVFRTQAQLRLTKLSIAHNPRLGASAGLQLLEVCRANDCIKNLDIDDTGIEGETFDRIHYLVRLNHHPKALKDQLYLATLNHSGLFSVDVQYDASDPRTMSEDSIDEVVAALKNNDVVRALLLDRCCRGEACVRHLLPVLRENRHLTKLSLVGNMLGAEAIKLISEAIHSNSHSRLEFLDLRENEIDDEGADILTRHLRSSDVVRSIRVDGNLRVSDDRRFALQTAAAANNEPREVKEVVSRITANDEHLTEVILRGGTCSKSAASKGYITSLGAKTLSEALTSNTVVHTVDLRDHHIGPEGAAAIGRMLKTNTTVTDLCLSGNPITDEGARHIIQGLAHNDSIVVCDLHGCGVSDPLLTEIEDVCRVNVQPLPVKALFVIPAATNGLPDTIDLSRRSSQPRGKLTVVNEETFLMIRHTIKQQDQTISCIDFSDQPLSEPGTEWLCVHWIEANLRIRELRLVNCQLTDTCVQRIMAAVRQNTMLRRISVAANPAVSFSAQVLLEDAVGLNAYPRYFKSAIPLLTGNVTTLREVRLIHDGLTKAEPKFGDDGMKILTDALLANTHVTKVVVQNHNVSDRGISYFKALLTANPTITHLDLNSNDIGTEGAKDFATLLATNRVLFTELHLSHNSISEEGALSLLEALHVSNTSVARCRVLTLDENPRVSAEVREAVRYRLVELGQPIEFRAAFSKHGVLLKRRGVAETGQATPPPTDSPLDIALCRPAPSLLWHRAEITFERSQAALDDTSCEALLGLIKLQKHYLAPEPCCLTRLALNKHKIRDFGVGYLIDLVRCTGTISSVSLIDNAIENIETVHAITRLVQEATHVTSVDLAGNPVAHGAIAGDEASVALKKLNDACRANRQSRAFNEVLRKLTTLGAGFVQAVNLADVDVDDDGLDLLCQRLVATADFTETQLNAASSGRVTPQWQATPQGHKSPQGRNYSDMQSSLRGSFLMQGSFTMPGSRGEGLSTGRFFVPTPAVPQSLIPGMVPLLLLTRVDLSANPRITDAGIAKLCRWLLVAAPNLQDLVVANVSITSSGAHAIKDYAWSTHTLLTCSVADLAQTAANAIQSHETDAHAAALEAALSSISARMVENADNAAVHGVGQELAAKMPTGSFWTATVPGDNRGRAFPSDELRDAERSVLDDALSNMPKRNRYIRGQHRSIAEARLAAARERAASL